MADREKVEKGIKACWSKYFYHSCCDCPYMIDRNDEKCVEQLGTDVLELLKEQEAVEPTFKQDKDGIFVWACGSCGAYMYHIYDGIDKAKEYAKFCRQCGKAVKWE